jgi:hypothetical protein
MTRDEPLFDLSFRRRLLDDQHRTSDAGDRLPCLSFGVFPTSNLGTTIPGLEAGGVITIGQTEMPVLLPLSPNEARRDAGGSRTHLNRFAAGRLAVWLQRRKVMSLPGIEPGPRPSQSRMRIRHTPRT